MSQTNARFQGAGILLPIGGTVGSVNAGEKVMSLDSTGNAMLTLPDGSTTGIGFTSNTTVTLPNSNAVPVNALQVTASLPTNTAGAEESQWLVKLMTGGAQVNSLIMQANNVWAPNGTAAQPGYGFLGTARDGTTGLGYGMRFDQSNTRLGWSVAGADALFMTASNLIINSNGGQVAISGSAQDVGFKRNGGADNQLFTGRNIVMGADGALATNAAAGHLTIPSCAGTPTGTVVLQSGKVALIYDSTNFKLAVSAGGGTWKQTVALT
jgi:hypothetical protein